MRYSRASLTIVMMTMQICRLWCKCWCAIGKKMGTHNEGYAMYVDGYEMEILSSCSWKWVSGLVLLGVDEGGEIVYMGVCEIKGVVGHDK